MLIFLLSMLRAVVLLNIFVETDTFFWDSLMNRIKKKELFVNINTFGQFHASLLN